MIGHTDKLFEKELDDLKSAILQMGGLVEQMLSEAFASIMQRDAKLALKAIATEPQVNQLEIEVDKRCFDLLALRQPAGSDLRFILTCTKISKDLERVGDMAVNMGLDAKSINTLDQFNQQIDLSSMFQLARQMIKQSLDAFVTMDSKLAQKVLEQDDLLDDLNRKVQSELVQLMKKNPEVIETAVRLTSIAKKLERTGDLATNIAEQVVFLVEGKDIRHQGKS